MEEDSFSSSRGTMKGPKKWVLARVDSKDPASCSLVMPCISSGFDRKVMGK